MPKDTQQVRTQTRATEEWLWAPRLFLTFCWAAKRAFRWPCCAWCPEMHELEEQPSWLTGLEPGIRGRSSHVRAQQPPRTASSTWHGVSQALTGFLFYLPICFTTYSVCPALCWPLGGGGGEGSWQRENGRRGLRGGLPASFGRKTVKVGIHLELTTGCFSATAPIGTSQSSYYGQSRFLDKLRPKEATKAWISQSRKLNHTIWLPNPRSYPLGCTCPDDLQMLEQ